MFTFLMMSATPISYSSLLKLKIFWNKDYDFLIPDYEVIETNFLRDSNDIVEVVMWPTFGNPSISMREVIISSNLYRFDQKNHFFEGWYWFKFDNLGLELGTTLKFYVSVNISDISVTKGLKIKVRKFWELSPMFVEVTGEKLLGGLFCPLLLPILNRVKSFMTDFFLF